MLTVMTALPVLVAVNNDKRETLSFIFQVGLSALEECIKKNKFKKLKNIRHSTGKGLLL